MRSLWTNQKCDCGIIYVDPESQDQLVLKQNFTGSVKRSQSWTIQNHGLSEVTNMTAFHIIAARESSTRAANVHVEIAREVSSRLESTCRCIPV